MYRLLIVDGESEICREIKCLINWDSYGFSSIMTAYNYPDAISKALDLQPHVALIDVELGPYWGYDLAAQFRMVGLKTVSCMISSTNDFVYAQQSMRAGAQDFLLKPIDREDLRSFVERTVVNALGGVLPEGGVLRQEVDPVLHAPYSGFSKITNKILLFTRENYHSPLSLLTIAETFNMNSKYIGRIFLKDTGMKFSEYLMACRMQEAKRLIVNTQDKIFSIANAVGYSQLNNFYTHFKDYFGTSPGTLRNFNEAEG